MQVNNAQPSIMVVANGTSIPGVLVAEVTNDSFMGADRYRLDISLEACGYDAWSGNDIELDISIGLSGALQNIISGPVDRVDVDIGSNIVHVTGRDFISRFIEARIQESFKNVTADEIVTTLAQRRGLWPNLTKTSSLVGRAFGGGYTRTTLDQFSGLTTEWDLLAHLADAEGFDIWVDGRTLNFMPITFSPPVTFISPKECLGLRLERQLALCSNLQVVVKSWDCRSQQAVSQSAGAEDGADPRKYVIIRPNLSEAAAAQLAAQMLVQIAQNARVITVEMPGNLVTKPRQSLLLQNTGTDFDGIYSVVAVERSISFERGFTQTLQARTPPWTAFSII